MLEEKLMRRALKLAEKGQSNTNPNPLVGAVLVKNNQVVGEGFHTRFGEAHAEVNAINQAGKTAKGSTLFVALEPCSHHGNTPPCTDAIISAGIKKVVYASKDPAQKNSSKILQSAGIDITHGILKEEADFLNRKFLYFAKHELPYITIKFAVSLDGKLATKTYDSKWITNEKARAYARALRAEHQAVLVGSKTVIQDDPHLGVRTKNKKDPLRIILDTSLKTSPDSQVYRDSNVIVFTGKNAEEPKVQLLRDKNILVHKFDSLRIEIKEVLKQLAKLKIISVLVEGGGETIGSFVDNKTVNEVYAFYAPIIVGGENARSIAGFGAKSIKEAMRIKNPQIIKFDDNLLVHGLV